jgi:hypothetical protein
MRSGAKPATRVAAAASAESVWAKMMTDTAIFAA